MLITVLLPSIMYFILLGTNYNLTKLEIPDQSEKNKQSVLILIIID